MRMDASPSPISDLQRAGGGAHQGHPGREILHRPVHPPPSHRPELATLRAPIVIPERPEQGGSDGADGASNPTRRSPTTA